MAKQPFKILDHVTENLLIKTIERLGEAPLTETSHNYNQYGSIKIIDAATESYNTYHIQAKKLPAISLIEVVLAANRSYNLHVLPNINRLKSEFSKLISFDDLESLIENHIKEEFYQIWGHKNDKKYQTLKNILTSVQNYKTQSPNLTDFEIMKNWADKVDIENYTNDIIGQHPNIAIATIQHLRMVFGADTIKPDLRVMEVLEHEFSLKGINQINSIKAVEQISSILHMPALLLDQIFVLYGSGYYNKHVRTTLSNNNEQIRVSIAKKLKMLGVTNDIISQSTGLSLTQVSEL